MNILNSLKVYRGTWEVTERRKFNAEELASAKSAVVVEGDYNNAVKITIDGGDVYIPVSENSSLTLGQIVDLTKVELLTLSRPGDDDILRIE